MKTKILTALALAALCTSARGLEPTALTVHEWGTFTSLQDESGRAIGGINTDDEPVPTFVHNAAGILLLTPTELPSAFLKGAPSCHPDVTMRLETPVIYFHAAAGVSSTVDVHVGFQGGWLTQFYPQAVAVTPGIADGWRFGHLTDRTLGTLDWRGLRVNVSGDGPETTERVWLAPRAARADGVQTQDGEQEKFLFYRGVGHLDAPLRVTRSADGAWLSAQPPVPEPGKKSPPGSPSIRKLWFVDIRPDGTAAFRTLRITTPGGDDQGHLFSIPAGFTQDQYAAANVGTLRASLRTDLVAEGLYEDEADALLNTWEVSYFKSPGERLFFLVPHSWTDAVLPLTVSGVPHITRVMVGRIELVTPRQREGLARLAATPAGSENVSGILAEVNAHARNGQPFWSDVYSGRKTLAQAGVVVPAAYQTYLDLGRFRNALLLDEQARHPNARLAEFIQNCGLQGYQVPPDADPSPR